MVLTPEAGHPPRAGDGTGATGTVAGWSEGARAQWLEALARGGQVALTLSPRAGRRAELERWIVQGGGQVLWTGRATPVLAARVPAAVVPRLLPLVEAIEVARRAGVAVPSAPSPGPETGTGSTSFERALHQANQEVLGAPALRSVHGVTGRGVRVAVIDTGVDPGLPAFQRHLVDYVDFTSAVPFVQRVERARAAGEAVLQQGQNPAWAAEGDVFLTGTARAGRAGGDGATLRWGNLQVRLPAWAAGTEVRLGWLDEANVGPGGTDLNGNGTARDRWLVVAYPWRGDRVPVPGGDHPGTGAAVDGGVEARQESGRGAATPAPGEGTAGGAGGTSSPAVHGPAVQGPAVQIDSDQDLNLAEETVLWPLAAGGPVAWLAPAQPSGQAAVQGGDGGTALVVTAADPGGILVNFGFDANGHGTRMASILAAAGTAYQGVAPGTGLMVLKALGSRGQGDWSQILAAVDYAVAQGADIISLSAESQTPGEELAVTERVLRQAMARGVLPVLAAGNGGPGLHTALALPADAGLVVGAFLPGAAADLLGDPAGERLLPYSAAGPARDGTPSPSLVGPGVTYTLVPAWQEELWPGGLAPDEGTSVAVPYIAGLAALLLEHARREAPQWPAAALAPVLQASARPLPGVPAAVQGFGVPEAAAAVERLAERRRAVGGGEAGPPSGTGWSITWLHRGRPYRGVVWEGAAPGVLTLAVGHGGGQPVTGRWTGTPPWARFPGPMPYPGGDGIYLPAQYDLPGRPGLYSALVRLEGGPSLPAGFLQTFVRPYLLDGDGLEVTGQVGRGQIERVFVEVPPGVTRLVVRVDRPGDGAEGAAAEQEGGSLNAWVYAPGGRLVRDSARDTGRLIGGPELPDWTVEIPSPEPGVWEVDLFFSTLSPVAFDRRASSFRVTVTAQGVAWEPRELEVRAPGAQGGRLWAGVTLVPYGRAVRGRVAGMGWDVPVETTARPVEGNRPEAARQLPPGPSSATEQTVGGAPGPAAGETASAAQPAAMAEERAQVMVLAGEPQPYGFDVPTGTALLEVQAGPVPRAGWRPRLYLYRVEGGAAEPVGDGRGEPVAVVADPPPGRYYAVVELEPTGAGAPSWDEPLDRDAGPLAIPLVLRRFRDGGGIRVSAGSVELAAGQPARIMALLDVPPGTGEPQGYLVLLDEAGAVGAPLPVRVRRGPPRLVVTALVPPLSPGVPARITLQVRDRTDGRLRDASLIVQGRLYTTAGGQVTLAWDGRSSGLVVRVLGAGEESVQVVPLPPAS